jgi:hypothetical protein
MEDRANSALLRKQYKIHRRVSTQVNNSGLISPHSLAIETLSPVNSTRRNNLFRDRTTDRYGSRGPSEADRKPSTSSHYRIRKIGPKLIGGDAESESAAFRGDPTTRSAGFAKQLRSFNDQGDTLRAMS